MKKPDLQQLTTELFEKLKGIHLTGQALAAYQTTNNQSVLMDLQKKSAALVQAVQSKQPKGMLLGAHEDVAAAIDTAGILGVISNEELPGYYKKLDDIWMDIEKGE
ncbi:hypothetical protein H0V99_00415 [Candidatus Saccharibacteria bacterium]|nr:hypothetical protein [Candidatus Saccharibacteria bacterium]